MTVHRTPSSDDAPDGGCILVKETAPERICHEDHVVASCRRFFGSEAAADGGLDAEHREKTRRDGESFDLDGARSGADVELNAPEERGFLEDVDAFPPRHVVGGRDRRGADTPHGVCLVDLNEAVGVAVGKRPEQHGARQREDRGVDAESEREGDDGDEREPGPGRERAKGSGHPERSVLFVSQREHRIDAGRAPGRKIASHERDRREQHRRTGQRDRVVGR